MKKISFLTLIMIFELLSTSFKIQGKYDLPIIKNIAFKRGEKLTYNLHYGFIDAATATLSVTNEKIKFSNRETYHVVGVGKTNGITDWIFKVRDRYESYIDEKALVPWLFIRRVNEGGYIINQDYIFKRFENKVKTEKNNTYHISENMQDMISAFYQARTFDFSEIKIGDEFSIDCFMDEEVFPVKIMFKGYENIKIELGKIRCMKFIPLLQTGRVFKKEDDLSFFISDDENHVLVKAKADILFGAIEVELIECKGLIRPLTINL